MTETNIINHLLLLSKNISSPYVSLGIGDDAAVIQLPSENEMAISVDTLVEGVHFLPETSAFDIGSKSLAVSLSDMAAMGATPFSVLLSLSMPTINEQWLQKFAAGFFQIANEYQVMLIGGDTTRGPLSISTIVNGFLPLGKALTRKNAQVGDFIYVTGYLGLAALGLQILQKNKSTDTNLLCIQRLNQPKPRVKEALLLRELIHAAINISDGLIIDLEKMLHQSRLGAVINVDKILLASDLQNCCTSKEAIDLTLSGGDDYELCFTVPKKNVAQLEKISKDFSCKISCIGQVCAEPGLKILNKDGSFYEYTKKGYEHFC